MCCNMAHTFWFRPDHQKQVHGCNKRKKGRGEKWREANFQPFKRRYLKGIEYKRREKKEKDGNYGEAKLNLWGQREQQQQQQQFSW